MKNNKATLIVAFLFTLLQLSFFVSDAQTKKVDSLRALLYAKPTSSGQLPLLFALCEELNSMPTDSLEFYSNKACNITKTSDNVNDISQANFYRAACLNKKGNHDSAIHIADSFITVLQTTKTDESLRYRLTLLKSNALIRSNKQKESIGICLQLLHEADLSKDYFAQMRAKNNIGWSYLEMEQYSDALKWLLQAKKIDEEENVGGYQPYLYSNISAVYNNLGKRDSAEYFIKKALAYAIAKQDLTYMANSYFIYASITDDAGRKAETENLLEQGLAIRRKIGDAFYTVSDIFQLGLFYANNKESAKGIAVSREGIELANKNNLFEKLPLLYTSLAANYKAENNYVMYGAAMDTLMMLKDSVYKKNSAEALAEMQTKYDLQKKENTIIEQKYDLAKKNDLVFGSIAVLVATLLFGFFYLQNRKKNQQLKLQAVEMEQKKNTAKAVMQAEEHERKRIAGDLHDSVAQKMVVAKLNLEALKKSLNGVNEQQQKILANAQSLLEESTTEVRNLSHSMMPHVLAYSGLADTVKSFLDKIAQPGLVIHFNASGDFSSIPENTSLMVYRIMQECVQNVLKHASATRLDISMIAEENELDVTIEDNGVGFDINAANIAATNGLKNLRSRIEYLNGTLDMNSAAGDGTIVAFYVPLQQA